MGITGQLISFVHDFGTQISSLPIEEAIIFDIALILIISAILAFIAKLMRQPLIPAYVVTGIIIGPLLLGLIAEKSIITAFSEIGIAFLLFTAGIEISFKKIKEANLKKILAIGLVQMAVIFGAVFILRNF